LISLLPILQSLIVAPESRILIFLRLRITPLREQASAKIRDHL